MNHLNMIIGNDRPTNIYDEVELGNIEIELVFDTNCLVDWGRLFKR